jgi:hypothetical protein
MVTKKQQDLINELQSICEELGWVIAINETGSPGFIAGDTEFVVSVLEILQSATGEEFEVYTKDIIDEGLTEVTPKSKKTFH